MRSLSDSESHRSIYSNRRHQQSQNSDDGRPNRAQPRYHERRLIGESRLGIFYHSFQIAIDRRQLAANRGNDRFWVAARPHSQMLVENFR